MATSVEVEAVMSPATRDDFFTRLRELGYEPREVPSPEARDAASASEVLLWVAEKIGAPAALKIGRSRRRMGQETKTR